MRHETKLNAFRDDDSVEWTLDDYSSSSTRKVTAAAIILGIGFVVFAAGYWARVVEERMGHDHRPAITPEPAWRAP